ncbi:hypothetical protein [Streptomyces spectabilis]|uniref:Phytoene/squalene synthetase n=1 Tax=Streptomyces spectabilis TaxID=68270 RepID=A0A7W8ETG6_STRST|nr:hypothetical protein [Streptomyces spectabilis]MBB5102640.1 phytoene/squalene synthetase [Streptomyces spectabilis]MCI3907677.1 hypothetical protein [Streptomyces spectabilis]
MTEAHRVVRAYSTTWYEPVTSMPPGLGEAVTTASLCMRGIDEVEGHPRLSGETKARALRRMSGAWQLRPGETAFAAAVAGWL